MAFDEEEWKKRMRAAKTGDELAAIVMELPDRGPPITPDHPDYFFMEPIITPELLGHIDKTKRT
jgi:hypothetical protein